MGTALPAIGRIWALLHNITSVDTAAGALPKHGRGAVQHSQSTTVSPSAVQRTHGDALCILIYLKLLLKDPRRLWRIRKLYPERRQAPLDWTSHGQHAEVQFHTNTETTRVQDISSSSCDHGVYM